MSVLSCLDSIKNNPRNRPQSRRLKESGIIVGESTSQLRPPALAKRTSTYSKHHLYSIDIVEEEQYKVKVHGVSSVMTSA